MNIQSIVASIAGAALITCGAAQASDIAPTICPFGFEPVDSEELIRYGQSLGLSDLTTRQDRFEPFMVQEFIDALSEFPGVVITPSSNVYSTFDLILNRPPGRLNFGSTDRRNATNALYSGVEPDGIGRVYAWANDILTAAYGYRAGPAPQSFASVVADAKAKKGGINLSTDDHQGTGFMEILRRAPVPQNSVAFPTLIYLTTSDAIVGDFYSSRATSQNIAIWQSTLCEDPLQTRLTSTARFIITAAFPRNPDVYFNAGYRVGQPIVPQVPALDRLF